MSDTFNENGLTLSTLDETLEQLKTDCNNIYRTDDGEDINFGPETPDGQALNIFAQAGQVLRSVVAEINSSFDPDQAWGSILDQRVKLNNITRKTGSFSTTYITINVNQTITLQGLDENYTSTAETG